MLSDHAEQVGVAYGARDAGTDKVNFAKRIAYLIDPAGEIKKAYTVGDVNSFAGDVLNDLRALQ